MAISDVSTKSFSNELMRLSLSIIWKNKARGLAGDPSDIRPDVEAYIAARNGTLNFHTVENFDEDILKAFIPDVALFTACRFNKKEIPEDLRPMIIQAQQSRIIQQWESPSGEPNEYYRMLFGLPPIDAPFTEFLYNDRYADIDMETPIHLLSYADRLELEKRGFFASLLDKYPDSRHEYIKHLGLLRIYPYISRTAEPFAILYIGDSQFEKLRRDFIDVYEEARRMVVRVYYSDAYRNKDAMYEAFMGLCILFMTQQRMYSKYIEADITRDFYDLESLCLVYDAYGMPFYATIPLKYHTKIVKRMNELIAYKGSTQVFYDLFNIFDFGDMNVFEYFLVKRRLVDPNGNPVFRDKYGKPLDERNMWALRFARVQWEDHKFLEVANPENYIPYTQLTIPDPYWVEDSQLQEKLYKRDWNYFHSKYMGVQIMFEVTRLTFEICYFLRMLEDNRGTTEEIKTYFMVTGDDVPLYDLVVYAIALLCRNAGYESTIPSDPASVATVLGFNFKEINELLKIGASSMNDFIKLFKEYCHAYAGANLVLSYDTDLYYWIDQITDGAFSYLGNDFNHADPNAPPHKLLHDWVPTNNSVQNLKNYLKGMIDGLRSGDESLDIFLYIMYQKFTESGDAVIQVACQDSKGRATEYQDFWVLKDSFDEDGKEQLIEAFLLSYEHMYSYVQKLLDIRTALTFDPHILELIQNMDILNVQDVDRCYHNMKELDNYIAIKLRLARTREEYNAYYNARKILLTTNLVRETFELSDGTVAPTYERLLFECNPKLYERLTDPETDLNSEEQYVLQCLMNLCDDLQYLTMANMANIGRITDYLMKILMYLKSAKVDLVDFDIIFMISDRGHNYIKFLDEIYAQWVNGVLTDPYYIWDKIHLVDILQVLMGQHYTLTDFGYMHIRQELRDYFDKFKDEGYIGEVIGQLGDASQYWFDCINECLINHQLRTHLDMKDVYRYWATFYSQDFIHFIDEVMQVDVCNWLADAYEFLFDYIQSEKVKQELQIEDASMTDGGRRIGTFYADEFLTYLDKLMLQEDRINIQDVFEFIFGMIHRIDVDMDNAKTEIVVGDGGRMEVTFHATETYKLVDSLGILQILKNYRDYITRLTDWLHSAEVSVFVLDKMKFKEKTLVMYDLYAKDFIEFKDTGEIVVRMASPKCCIAYLTDMILTQDIDERLDGFYGLMATLGRTVTFVDHTLKDKVFSKDPGGPLPPTLYKLRKMARAPLGPKGEDIFDMLFYTLIYQTLNHVSFFMRDQIAEEIRRILSSEFTLADLQKMNVWMDGSSDTILMDDIQSWVQEGLEQCYRLEERYHSMDIRETISDTYTLAEMVSADLLLKVASAIRLEDMPLVYIRQLMKENYLLMEDRGTQFHFNTEADRILYYIRHSVLVSQTTGERMKLVDWMFQAIKMQFRDGYSIVDKEEIRITDIGDTIACYRDWLAQELLANNDDKIYLTDWIMTSVVTGGKDWFKLTDFLESLKSDTLDDKYTLKDLKHSMEVTERPRDKYHYEDSKAEHVSGEESTGYPLKDSYEMKVRHEIRDEYPLEQEKESEKVTQGVDSELPMEDEVSQRVTDTHIDALPMEDRYETLVKDRHDDAYRLEDKPAEQHVDHGVHDALPMNEQVTQKVHDEHRDALPMKDWQETKFEHQVGDNYELDDKPDAQDVSHDINTALPMEEQLHQKVTDEHRDAYALKDREESKVVGESRDEFMLTADPDHVDFQQEVHEGLPLVEQDSQFVKDQNQKDQYGMQDWHEHYVHHDVGDQYQLDGGIREEGVKHEIHDDLPLKDDILKLSHDDLPNDYMYLSGAHGLTEVTDAKEDSFRLAAAPFREVAEHEVHGGDITFTDDGQHSVDGTHKEDASMTDDVGVKVTDSTHSTGLPLHDASEIKVSDEGRTKYSLLDWFKVRICHTLEDYQGMADTLDGKNVTDMLSGTYRFRVDMHQAIILHTILDKLALTDWFAQYIRLGVSGNIIIDDKVWDEIIQDIPQMDILAYQSFTEAVKILHTVMSKFHLEDWMDAKVSHQLIDQFKLLEHGFYENSDFFDESYPLKDLYDKMTAEDQIREQLNILAKLKMALVEMTGVTHYTLEDLNTEKLNDLLDSKFGHRDTEAGWTLEAFTKEAIAFCPKVFFDELDQVRDGFPLEDRLMRWIRLVGFDHIIMRELFEYTRTAIESRNDAWLFSDRVIPGKPFTNLSDNHILEDELQKKVTPPPVADSEALRDADLPIVKNHERAPLHFSDENTKVDDLVKVKSSFKLTEESNMEKFYQNMAALFSIRDDIRQLIVMEQRRAYCIYEDWNEAKEILEMKARLPLKDAERLMVCMDQLCGCFRMRDEFHDTDIYFSPVSGGKLTFNDWILSAARIDGLDKLQFNMSTSISVGDLIRESLGFTEGFMAKFGIFGVDTISLKEWMNDILNGEFGQGHIEYKDQDKSVEVSDEAQDSIKYETSWSCRAADVVADTLSLDGWIFFGIRAVSVSDMLQGDAVIHSATITDYHKVIAPLVDLLQHKVTDRFSDMISFRASYQYLTNETWLIEPLLYSERIRSSVLTSKQEYMHLSSGLLRKIGLASEDPLFHRDTYHGEELSQTTEDGMLMQDHLIKESEILMESDDS